VSESYKTFEQIDFTNDPFEMTTKEIMLELKKIMPFLKDNYCTAYCHATIARIEQYQNELTRRNIEEGSKSATRWSKWATGIALFSLLIILGFSVANYFSDKCWQYNQLKTLEKIETNTQRGN
jgi:hypothetical protein